MREDREFQGVCIKKPNPDNTPFEVDKRYPVTEIRTDMVHTYKIWTDETKVVSYMMPPAVFSKYFSEVMKPRD